MGFEREGKKTHNIHYYLEKIILERQAKVNKGLKATNMPKTVWKAHQTFSKKIRKEGKKERK